MSATGNLYLVFIILAVCTVACLEEPTLTPAPTKTIGNETNETIINTQPVVTTP